MAESPREAGSAGSPLVGYCANVHPGRSLDDVLKMISKDASGVRERVAPTDDGDGRLPLGLWLSQGAVDDLQDGRRMDELRRALDRHQIRPFTLNGFPQGDFHAGVVKKRVYRPNWAQKDRAEYTVRLASLLSGLLPAGTEGSISTLPLGWRPEMSGADLEAATVALVGVGEELARLEDSEGRLIHLDLEPEPGCVLDRAADVVALFDRLHAAAPSAERISRYLRVCHDVCHSAVMFEDQQDALETYANAGIGVGKVQVSSALRARISAGEEEQAGKREPGSALAQLGEFQEDRYLHQTTIRTRSGDVFFEDLPLALASIERGECIGEEARTHFHVPVHLREIGLLETTQDQIMPAISAARKLHGTTHFEVETYAWGVLPPHMQTTCLADGIADELIWVRSRMDSLAGDGEGE